jgi:hypothetical protein
MGDAGVGKMWIQDAAAVYGSYVYSYVACYISNHKLSVSAH